MLDCLIIQEKTAGASEMYWSGPGLVAQTEKAMSCLGALQAALHFTQLHLTVEGPALPTTTPKDHRNACPFTGGSAVERADQYPSAQISTMGAVRSLTSGLAGRLVRGRSQGARGAQRALRDRCNNDAPV